MARKIVEQDCEAVVCGSIEKPAFEVLAAAQVTRYMGAGLVAITALRLMEEYQLDLIRVPNGERWDAHHIHAGKCECG